LARRDLDSFATILGISMTSTELVALCIFNVARSLWELETLCYNKLKLRTWHAIVVLFLVSYLGWNVGGLKLVCTKDMSEQEASIIGSQRLGYLGSNLCKSNSD